MMTAKLRKQIDADDRLRSCFISTDEPVQIHHAVFGSGRPEEFWNYVPLRIDFHLIGPEAVHDGNKLKIGGGKTLPTDQVCELFALLRAPREDLIKYNLMQRLRWLRSKSDILEYVEMKAEMTGWELPNLSTEV
jgi:hypothetical protein